MNSRLTIIGLSLASFLGCVDLTGMSTILPSIQKVFNTSFSTLQWINSIVFIALACSTTMVGKLSDIYGKKRILHAGMFLIIVASLGAGLSISIYSLIAFRFLQGLAIAVFYTIPIALLSEILPKEGVAKATGTIIAANGIGLAIGPVLGGAISQYAGWQWIFFINIPLIIISFILCRFIPSQRKEHEVSALSIPRSIFFMVLVFGSIVLINGSLPSVFTDNITLNTICFLIIIFLFVYFYLSDSKSDVPLINYRDFKNRNFLLGIAVNMVLAFSYSILLFMIPQYLKKVVEISDGTIGTFMLAVTLMMSLCSFLAGKLLGKGAMAMKIILSGLVCFFLCLIIQEGFRVNVNINIALILISLLLFGGGWGLILTPSIVTSMSSVAENQKGSSMGTLVTLHNLSAAISLSSGVHIYKFMHDRFIAQHTSHTSPIKNLDLHAFIYGYHGLMNVLSIAMAMVVIATLFFLVFSKRFGCEV